MTDTASSTTTALPRPIGPVVKRAREAVAAVVAELEPGVLDAGLAAQLVEEFDQLERVSAAGKALAARRVADSNRWIHDGSRSPEQWLADKTGSGLGQAAGVLDTAQQLERLPEADAAFRAGALSVAQVSEVAAAAHVAPDQERRLLAAAASSGLKGLRDACRNVRAAAQDDKARAQRIHSRRSLRHWTDREGAFCLSGRMTAEAGATFLAGLEPVRDQIFTEARRAGRRERNDAYAADALVVLASRFTAAVASDGGDSASGATAPRRTVHVRVDHAALTRGVAESTDTCEIVGVGPIPVATAKAMMSDCLLKVLVIDGVDVRTVAHAGRTIPAKIRTALLARSTTCEVPGCDTGKGLEIDHVIPFADGGPSTLDNLQLLCGHHHRQKTHDGYHLTGPPGHRRWHRAEPGEGPHLVLTAQQARGDP